MYMPRSSITDAAFARMSRLRVLDVSHCYHLTDAAFDHDCFASLEVLVLERCSQEGLTDAAFRKLHNLKKLCMWHVNQEGVTDAAFKSMPRLTELDVSECAQLTGAFFAHLPRLAVLNITRCRAIVDASFAFLPVTLTKLCMEGMPQLGDVALEHLDALPAVHVERGKSYRGVSMHGM